MKKLIQLVKLEYGIDIHRTKKIHDSPKSFVLKLQTDKGPLVLKTLYTTLERQNFILEAEEHLRNKGILIPETILTREGKAFIVWSQYPYVLQKWVSGKHYPLISKKRIARMGALLGMIHSNSISFYPSNDNSSPEGNLEREYDEKLAHLKSWREQFKSNAPEKINAVLNEMEFFIQTGEKVRQLILNNPYKHRRFLCHGDFHTFNIKANGDSLHVIDWEDVRFDFPSKDITRILYVLMRRYKRWDKDKFNILFSAYLTENKLSPEEKKILTLDLAFPYIFDRFLRKKTYKKLSTKRIVQFLKREQEKAQYLLGLFPPQ